MKTKPQAGWLRINGKMVRVSRDEPKLPEPIALRLTAKMPISLSGALHAVAVPVRL